jgi:hypothetical protein
MADPAPFKLRCAFIDSAVVKSFFLAALGAGLFASPLAAACNAAATFPLLPGHDRSSPPTSTALKFR